MLEVGLPASGAVTCDVWGVEARIGHAKRRRPEETKNYGYRLLNKVFLFDDALASILLAAI